jgi:hypothetical protein
VTDSDPRVTRLSLHAVAELVLAGPQYEREGTIELRVVPGGFATTAGPDLRVTGAGDLVGSGQGLRIDGRTPRILADEVGVRARALDDVYADVVAVGLDDVLVVEDREARTLVDALVLGDAALRALAPAVVPVLWPEHFDVAITVDEVNYGVSPGDGYLSEPYAYVGPWRIPPADDYWSAPFGAARPMTDVRDSETLRSFFVEGRDRVAHLPNP